MKARRLTSNVVLIRNIYPLWMKPLTHYRTVDVFCSICHRKYGTSSLAQQVISRPPSNCAACRWNNIGK